MTLYKVLKVKRPEILESSEEGEYQITSNIPLHFKYTKNCH